MARVSALIQLMSDTARKAARKLARDFGEVENLQVSKKGPADFVTAADRRAERIIFEELSEARPGYGFLMEEGGEIEGSDKSHRWIIDPLDGTLNFMHAIPHFAISIALERDGAIVAGVVYDVIKDELFSAERNKGAFLHERRIQVSSRTRLAESVIATGIPFHGRPGHAQFAKELFAISSKVAGVRRFGAGALDMAWIAAGRYDGFWERGLQPWDIAAGGLIVQEAGGHIADLTGKGDPVFTGEIVAGNERIFRLLGEELSKVS